MRTHTKKEIEKACLRYRFNGHAAKALNLNSDKFQRLCTELNIETPRQRTIREKEEKLIRQKKRNEARIRPIPVPSRRIPFPNKESRSTGT